MLTIAEQEGIFHRRRYTNRLGRHLLFTKQLLRNSTLSARNQVEHVGNRA